MIQHMSRIRRKIGQAIFVLFTIKQTQVKDITKVKQRFIKRIEDINANFLLFKLNQPKVIQKQSCFNQIIEIVNK